MDSPDAYPFLGFRELIFPVIIEDHVIAELIVGQIVRDNQQPVIEERIRNLPQRHPDIFSSLSSDEQGRMASAILAEYKGWLNQKEENRIPANQKRKLTDDEYEQLISETIASLTLFEGHLNDTIKIQRDNYTKITVQRSIDSFLTPSILPNNAAEVNDETLEHLWKRVEEALKDVVEAFSFEYELIFGIDTLISKTNVLKVVGKTGRWKDVFSEEQLGWLLLDTEMLGNSQCLVCSRKQNSEYLCCLKGCDIGKLRDFQLIILSVGPSRKCTIGFLVGYLESNPTSGLGCLDQ